MCPDALMQANIGVSRCKECGRWVLQNEPYQVHYPQIDRKSLHAYDKVSLFPALDSSQGGRVANREDRRGTRVNPALQETASSTGKSNATAAACIRMSIGWQKT